MSHKNLEIIIIDDDELFLLLNKRELIKSDFHLAPKTFLDAKNALEYLKSLDQTERKILVFLDINMPEIDGWKFLVLLKGLNLNMNIKHILLTSSTDPKDKLIAQEYPEIIGFLEKPITKSMLIDLQKEEAFISFVTA